MTPIFTLVLSLLVGGYIITLLVVSIETNFHVRINMNVKGTYRDHRVTGIEFQCLKKTDNQPTVGTVVNRDHNIGVQD